MITGFIAFENAAHSACVIPVTSSTLSHFLKNPNALLVSQGAKGDSLIWRTRIFASASFASLKALEKLSSKANLTQKNEMGEGFARAHSACSARDGEISHRIDDAIRKIADRDITRAYLKSLTGGESKSSLFPAKDDDTPARNTLGFEDTIKLQRDMPSGSTKFK